ncbi:respiratory nitrate reductase beta subunit [Ureibacillus xyleni]|uniref:Respiratory nitrate reductase beta subunit n=1 Tax=Ureibacillus xyleni TaxID=614648 RepID=A0A285RYX6_9BACL|nr:respiratory nitrate reductase beta subunit [Ureibacillus xyleni]
MKIKAQIAMVMNLDKCIGCHTCSITCKTAWTNRPGAEYIWFNNVETKPGIGYPKKWEDQDIYKGGWELRKGKLELKAGTKLNKMAWGKIFYNPDMPEIKDFYEPWTYDYENLTLTGEVQHSPVARPKSVITGERMDVQWGPNWEDDLAGGHVIGPQDPNMKKIEEEIKFSFEQAFMVYLPRICEHCLNPGCVASCPSGAMYKRDEDGIVLVDQEACRGWRYCTTGCPYKKVYFNWKTNKAEKCTFCYPRIESGTPTICSETCVGRLRYLGVLLYDADKVLEAASTEDEKGLYQAHCDLFLDPHDPAVIEQARKDGISEEWIEGAQNSPVYKLAIEYKLAFPLHPEYRTLPMVWYVPPLSPIMNYFEGKDSINNPDMIFPAIEEMRVPIDYLANLLTAGDAKPVKEALQKMAMMRMYMRADSSGKQFDEKRLEQVGLTANQIKQMYRLLSIAKYDDRYVIPKSHRENYVDPYHAQGIAGFEMGNNVSYVGTENGNFNNNTMMDFSAGCSGCSVGSSAMAPVMATSTGCGDGCGCSSSPTPIQSSSGGCGDGCGCGSTNTTVTAEPSFIPKLTTMLKKTGEQLSGKPVFEENFYGGIWRD